MVGGPAAVFQQQTLVAAIIGFTHCCMHAYVCCDTCQDQVFNAAQSEDHVKIRGVERPLAGLVEE